MTFTYSGDPSSSDVDEIRFYLQDTDGTDPLLQNEEIQFYITKLHDVYGHNIATASYLADLISNRFAREISISADGVTVGAQELQQKYRDVAKMLRQQWHTILGTGGAPDVGGIIWGEELDSSIKPLSFGKGQHDNVRAGQQEYGGDYAPVNWPGVRDSWYGYWGPW